MVDSGYMEAGGKGDVANLPGVEFFHRDHRVYHFSVPLVFLPVEGNKLPGLSLSSATLYVHRRCSEGCRDT